MKATEWAFSTTSETLSALASRQISSVELLQTYIRQVRAHPEVNALVTIDEDRALREAREADALRANGAPVGRLHGLPISVKHDTKVGGMPSTYGSVSLKDYVPEHDSEAVARLRAAGAIVFARSNLPEFASDGQAYNGLHGTTRNPWDMTRTTGGSSGGSAAAVAAGMTGLELGSDMGGSIRIPAAWCGVFGLKPTWGVVPMSGAVPFPGESPGASLMEADVAVTGPLARGADDLDLALRILAAPRHRGGMVPELRTPRATSHQALRALVWLDDETVPTDPATLAVLEEACTALERDGAVVVRAQRPPADLGALEELFETMFMADLAGNLDEASFEEVASGLDLMRASSQMSELHHLSTRLSHREWLALERRRRMFAMEWHAIFDDYDVVLTPTVLTTALEHDHSEPVWDRRFTLGGVSYPWRPTLTRWCGAPGVLRLPAVSVPVGTASNGLPVGMQVNADQYDDRNAIAAAALIAQSTGGYQRPPFASATGSSR